MGIFKRKCLQSECSASLVNVGSGWIRLDPAVSVCECEHKIMHEYLARVCLAGLHKTVLFFCGCEMFTEKLHEKLYGPNIMLSS